VKHSVKSCRVCAYRVRVLYQATACAANYVIRTILRLAARDLWDGALRHVTRISLRRANDDQCSEQTT